jgi:hypothetical protein
MSHSDLKFLRLIIDVILEDDVMIRAFDTEEEAEETYEFLMKCLGNLQFFPSIKELKIELEGDTVILTPRGILQ